MLAISSGCSVLPASTYAILSKRFTGLLQLTYSFVYPMDEVYGARLRDQMLYGRIRPKLFTSEPSTVTFAYTHFSAVWLVLSPWRWKLPAHLGLIGMALLVLPGPALVLMLLLTVPPGLPGGHPANRRSSAARTAGMPALSALLVGRRGRPHFLRRAAGQAGYGRQLSTASPARYSWPCYFPPLSGAGAGFTGEPFIANDVINVYELATLPAGWRITRIADVLTNYVWLQWIYLVWFKVRCAPWRFQSGCACGAPRACSIVGRYG